MEADFFSMYPSIILSYNISPETITEPSTITTEIRALPVNYPLNELVYVN